MAKAKGSRKHSAQSKRGQSVVLHSRPPLERIVEIHESVRRSNYPNASTLAQRMEVSTKTIHRDIRFMRDRWDLPIEFDAAFNGFKYTRPVDSFPMLQVNEGELFAMLIAEKAMQNYKGTVFEKRLSAAFKKISDSLPDSVNIHLNEWDEALSFRHTVGSEVEVELFDRICKATAKSRQLKILYKKPNHKPEERTIDPYQIANINNEWYLYAFDYKQQDIRSFVPARIEAAEITGKVFVRPTSFSLDNYLSSSFGVFKGNESYDIRIKFSKNVVPLIKEKNWHPTQKIKELKNGEVELRMSLSHLTDIKRWILSWGSQAKVLSPDELAECIQAEARAIIE
jgi:proteasome accessory factor B